MKIKSILLFVASMVLHIGAFAQTLIAVANVSGNEGAIRKSTDGGKNWTTVWDGAMESALTKKSALQGICQGNGKIVAVGKSIVMSSDSGKTWKEIVIAYPNTGNSIHSNTQRFFHGVAFGDGMFLAVGTDNHIMYSRDAENWQHVGMDVKFLHNGDNKNRDQSKTNEFASKYTPPKYIHEPRDVLFHNGKFVVVGGQFKLEVATFQRQGERVVNTSVVDMGPSAGDVNSGLQRIATDGKSALFAVSNSTKSSYSIDGGATWKAIYNASKKQMYTVAFAKDAWYGQNGFGDVFKSDDAERGWTDFGKLPVTLRGVALYDMQYVNGKLLGVGSDNTVLSSSDGLQWDKLNAVRESGMKLTRFIVLP